MALGRRKERKTDALVPWDKIPRSRGHVFYDRLQEVLLESKFDDHAETLCAPFYAAKMGRPSIPPGCYFRMHLVGYFEGIDSERGIEWRCADSLSLREFLLLDVTDRVPDHSTLSTTRTRLPLEVHREVFTWTLEIIAKSGLVKGDRIGVDASTMEANAALRNIVNRDTGENYRQMLARMAKENGIETPTEDDLIRMDRNRKGKKLSNADWKSPIDPDARVAKMKSGSTRLAYKPEHAVDLDTGAIVAAEIHHADEGDTSTLGKTLDAAHENLQKVVEAPPEPDNPTDVVTDKGYHSRGVLKALADSLWRSRISEPKANGINRWNGDHDARRAVYNNRTRTASGIGKELAKKRSELVERSFEHVLDRCGGMRRAWLRGCENVHKRYLIHVAGFNLALLMRQKFGFGTPRGWADHPILIFFVIQADFELHVTFLAIVAVISGHGSKLCLVVAVVMRPEVSTF